jgi:hypothetical protein
MTEAKDEPRVCVLTTIVIQADTDWVERSRSGGTPAPKIRRTLTAQVVFDRRWQLCWVSRESTGWDRLWDGLARLMR